MNELVFICHPFENKQENLEKTKRFCKMALEEDLIPISPALHYPQFLDDSNPHERELGQFCGLMILKKCDFLWVCGEYISKGMENEIKLARVLGLELVSKK